MKRIAVVGAGISGLTCAWTLEELRKKQGLDWEISVYESAPRAGGAIQTELRDGFLLEKGPDSFISEKPWVLDVCRKLGIESQVLDTQKENRKVSVVKDHRLVGLPEGFYLIAPTQIASLISTPLFSLAGKLRMACELLVPKRKSDSDESIAGFIRRRFGQEALDRVGQPMVAGIYSGDPERLSLLSLMPRFKELELKHGSVIRGLIHETKKNKMPQKVTGPRYGLFLSFERGMETLVRTLASRLPEKNLHLASKIKIERRGAGPWTLSEENGQSQSFDALCLTVSARRAAGLLKSVDESLAGHLGALSFESVATLNLAYKRQQIAHRLDSFGFVVPAIEKKSLTACTFVSQKYSGRAPKDYVLLRAFIGGAFGREIFDRNDVDLIKTVSGDLKDFLGISGEPCLQSLSRYENSLPQYGLNHAHWVQELEQRLERQSGLYLTGASYRGTGIANAVKEAEIEAHKIFSATLGGS